MTPLDGARPVLPAWPSVASRPAALVVGVVGGRGGAGASTLAAAVARHLARRTATVLVDLDRASGGIDVLLGLEAADGVRWPDLADARGDVPGADVLALLPRWGPCAVLSADRERPGAPEPAVVADVLHALTLEIGALVLDLDRAAIVAGESVAAVCDAVLVVAPRDLRAVAGILAMRPRLAARPVVARRPGSGARRSRRRRAVRGGRPPGAGDTADGPGSGGGPRTRRGARRGRTSRSVGRLVARSIGSSDVTPVGPDFLDAVRARVGRDSARRSAPPSRPRRARPGRCSGSSALRSVDPHRPRRALRRRPAAGAARRPRRDRRAGQRPARGLGRAGRAARAERRRPRRCRRRAGARGPARGGGRAAARRRLARRRRPPARRDAAARGPAAGGRRRRR